MAELFVITDAAEKELESVLAGFQEEGHAVQTSASPADTPLRGEQDGAPDLVLLDSRNCDFRPFFDRVLKQAGGFPIVISAQDTRKKPSGDAFSTADALYIPIGCDLDETLHLIKSVLSTWHRRQ
jgi:hypothetical protein